MNNTLRVIRAAELPERPASEPAWLVEPLWGLGAVGLIGGAPKCGKTWLALELAVAIASGRPALGHYPVHAPGTVLVYGAEDSPRQLRDRLAGLAQVRGADFASLAVHLIIEPSLRLDRQEDLRRLECTLQKYRPRLLVLDPYVRLQR
ncbi:MAG TPA: AAA family ATPase, partial [Terriglobales bacterium]|nr:AAA family ATPase [Terriglobales bacterium]